MIQSAQSRLAQAGIDNPGLDARLLIAQALDLDRAALTSQTQRFVSEEEMARIESLISRRFKREPVARILGLREFWGLPFGLNEATLEPRPDSETLIETALRLCETPPRRILDLGTGTGCLLLALLHEWPDTIGLGIDIASRAIRQAQINAARLGLETRATLQTGNWFDALEDRFDLILSNPPYISSKEIEALQPEVRLFDPLAALDGGADGLASYRKIIPQLFSHLNHPGLILFEVGAGQAPQVAALLTEAGFETSCHKDLGGIERCVAGQR